MDSIGLILASFVVRLVEIIFISGPWIVTGLFLAGFARRIIGPERLQQMFGGGGWNGILRGWVFGMLIPVCGLGAIPICREMRRAGLPGGTTLAFALSAPLFNPLSLLYGLSLSDPLIVCAYAFCSLVIVGLVGMVWDWLCPGTAQPIEKQDEIGPGWQRMVAVAVSSVDDLWGRTGLYITIGIVGSAVCASLVPAGYLQSSFNGDRWDAPLTMAMVGIPIYTTPLIAMGQIGSMFQHGNSIGAAFLLLIMGCGLNLGVLSWGWASYGTKRVALLLVLLLAVSLGLAYGIDAPLHPDGSEFSDHSHAFDMYSRPPMSSATTSELWRFINDARQRNTDTGARALAFVFLLGGIVTFLLRGKWNLLERLSKGQTKDKNVDPYLSPGFLTFAGISGLIAVSVAGVYIYYPARSTVLADMQVMNANLGSCAMAGDIDEAQRWISIQDDLARRLQVSIFIRSGQLGMFERMKIKVLRDDLEHLRDALDHGADADERRTLALDAGRSYRRLKTALKPDA